MKIVWLLHIRLADVVIDGAVARVLRNMDLGMQIAYFSSQLPSQPLVSPLVSPSHFLRKAKEMATNILLFIVV